MDDSMWNAFLDLARIAYVLRTLLNGVYGFVIFCAVPCCEERNSMHMIKDLFAFYRVSYCLCDSDQRTRSY